MGPKAEAAVAFVEAIGREAAIGSPTNPDSKAHEAVEARRIRDQRRRGGRRAAEPRRSHCGEASAPVVVIVVIVVVLGRNATRAPPIRRHVGGRSALPVHQLSA